ncbi:hypothetical protein EJ110_NYTH06214 [Nymphaea thermarum]|nr:hypothetical protein EJ110_NYTH06214 [Nymphaea thermarum]
MRQVLALGPGRPEEDERLRQLVEQHSPQNWNFIAELVLLFPKRRNRSRAHLLPWTLWAFIFFFFIK